jgi:DGQHR domain-containing protein
MEERFPGIARYYAENDNRYHIPTITASVRVYDQKSRTRFNTLFNAGNITKIHQEFGRDVFSIIDGQHRIGGLFLAWNKFEDFNADIPVMMYYGLTYVQEAKLFDDINVNQRKLPKALIEATKFHMDTDGKSHAQTIRAISMSLAEDGDSVWRDQVNMTGRPKAPEPVSYETLRRATGDMFPTRVLDRVEQRGFEPERVAKKYWELVSKACTTAWMDTPRFVENDEGEQVEEAVKYRLKDTVGVAALSILGRDIITTALDRTEGRGKEEFWDVMAEMVAKLGVIDWEKRRNNPWTSTSAGFGGQRVLYSLIYDAVYLGRLPGEEVEPDQR